MKFRNIILTSALAAAITVSATGCGANTGYTRTRTTTDGVTTNINRMFTNDRASYDNTGVANRQTRVVNPNVNSSRATRYTTPNYTAATPYSSVRGDLPRNTDVGINYVNRVNPNTTIVTPSQQAAGTVNNTIRHNNVAVTDTNNVNNVTNPLNPVATQAAPSAVRNNAVTNRPNVTRNREATMRSRSVANRAVTNNSVANRAVTNNTVANRALTNNAVANRAVTNNTVANRALTNNATVNRSVTNNTVANNAATRNQAVVNSTSTANAVTNNAIVNNQALNNRPVNRSITSRSSLNNSAVNRKQSTAVVNGYTPGPFSTYTNARPITSYGNPGLIGSINPTTTYSRSTNANSLMRTSITPNSAINSDRDFTVQNNNTVRTNPAGMYNTVGGAITSAR